MNPDHQVENEQKRPDHFDFKGCSGDSIFADVLDFTNQVKNDFKQIKEEKSWELNVLKSPFQFDNENDELEAVIQLFENKWLGKSVLIDFCQMSFRENDKIECDENVNNQTVMFSWQEKSVNKENESALFENDFETELVLIKDFGSATKDSFKCKSENDFLKKKDWIEFVEFEEEECAKENKVGLKRIKDNWFDFNN